MPLEKIAVDATALLSASIRGRALDVFLSAPILQFLTAAYTFQEALEHLPSVCRQRRIPLLDAEALLHTLPIIVCDEAHYQEKVEAAKGLIGKRDAKDADLLALALLESAPLWTNDPDFRIAAVTALLPVYTTTELLRLFNL